MIRTSLILALMLAPVAAMAQAAPGALDLSVPQAPVSYLGDPSYQSDAPGTFYGDRSGRRLPPKDSPSGDVVVDDKLQIHGAVSTGIGYSKAYGNSHWNAVDLNLGKNYTTDEGNTRRVDVNIHVSKSDGMTPYGFGPGPGPWYGW
ncbi:hypothetical protein [Stenotrophomonas humi]